MKIAYIIKKYIILILITLIFTVKADAIEIILKVAVNPNLPPYQFEENGKFKGLHIDIIEAVAKKNNLIIEYKPMPSNNKCLESLANGDVDIVLGAVNTNKYEKQATDSISQSSIIMIANKDYVYLINNKKDYGSIKTVMENNTISYSYIRKMSNLHYLLASNQIRAFSTLVSREVDALIGVKNSILYQLEKSNLEDDYTVVVNYMVPIEYTILTQSGDSDLRKLLNNELQRMRITGEYTKIYEKWINEDKYVVRKIMDSIIIMIVIFVAILLANFFFNRRLNTLLKKEVDEKTKELKAINNDLQKQIIETRNNNELKNCIVEHSLSAIIAVDTEYKITLFNQSACKLLNLQEVPIGDSAFDIPLLEEILDNIKNRIFAEDLKIVNEELTLEDEENNNNKKSYRYDINQLYNLDNSIRGAIITIDDVTEELRIKDQIFEREKNKALNKIIAGIAHEIRNPLTSIKAFIQLIPLKIDNQSFQNQLTKFVPKEVDRVNNLIKDLIDYAKPETNNKNITNLNEVINSCTFLIKPTLKNKNIKLIVSEEKDIKLYVDKNQLKQTLINIILNGLESMSEKISKFNITNKLHMNIRTWSSDKNVYITVSDEGMGMTDEEIKKSFEPFYTSKANGTGLGLSLSKQFIEENGGILTIESEPLLYTKITIRFGRDIGL